VGRTTAHRRTRGRGLRPWLIQVKLMGLALFFGGVAAIVAVGALGPEPADAAGWALLRGAMRAIFWPCVFGGLALAIVTGLVLFARHARTFAGTRWFRLKAALLVVSVPGLHLAARGRVLAFYAAIDEGRMADLPALRDRVTIAFAFAFVVMAAIAVIGRVKPRLGRPVPPHPAVPRSVTSPAPARRGTPGSRPPSGRSSAR
jgi:hypothetical protein